MRVPKTYINKFKQVEGECTAIVPVMATVDDAMLSKDNKRYFTPLFAIDINKYDELLELLMDEPEDDIDIELLHPFIITGVIWKNKVKSFLDLPVKGENVIATFEENDDGDITCTGISMVGKSKLKNFNFYKSELNVKNNIL